MENKEIKILFSGDFAPCRRFEELVIHKGEEIFGDSLEIIKSSDFSFLNLECPLTDSKISIDKSGPGLKAKKECINSLKSFTLIGLANNHIMDYGEKGLKDTIDLCESNNIKYVGAGINLEESKKISYVTIKEVTIAVIALAEYEFNQAEENKAGSAPIDLIENYKQIKEAKNNSDILIITLHAGNEYFPYPRPNLRKICHHFIELGADAIICHHPHVPGAYETYKEKPIFYSLGNLIFDKKNPLPDWEFGFMVSLTYNPKNKYFKDINIIPYKQSVEFGGLRLLKNNEKKDFLEKINLYRQNIENNINWLEEWNKFVKNKSNNYILKQYLPLTFKGMNFISRFIPISKIFYNKKNHDSKLNMLRCQSHYDVFIESLKLKSKEF